MTCHWCPLKPKWRGCHIKLAKRDFLSTVAAGWQAVDWENNVNGNSTLQNYLISAPGLFFRWGIRIIFFSLSLPSNLHPYFTFYFLISLYVSFFQFVANFRFSRLRFGHWCVCVQVLAISADPFGFWIGRVAWKMRLMPTTYKNNNKE